VFGTGGHASVVIDAWCSRGGVVLGWSSNDPPQQSDVEFVLEADIVVKAIAGPWVVAIGANATRLRVAHWLTDVIAASFSTVVHAAAVVSPSAQVSVGCQVMAGAVVNPRAVVQEHCIINTTALVEHDCHVGEAAHIAPGAKLLGNVSVGNRSFVGAGAVVLPGVVIGADVTVGAGSVVLKDVPSGVTVKGNPAR
jgi:UDP-perosamine 4-acetyltransferase